MAPKYDLSGILRFASSARSRSAVTWAAVSFALCHLLGVAAAPAPAGLIDLDEIPRQLIRFAAVFCRFMLSVAFLIAAARTRTKIAGVGRQQT
jgi:hypothetical protein